MSKETRKTERKLHEFITALLKYAENGVVFNPTFTAEEIPEIFGGWTELEFNIIHHGAGRGCCTYIGPGRYQINVGHCNGLQSKFMDSKRTKWRLIIAILSLAIAGVGLLAVVLKYCN